MLRAVLLGVLSLSVVGCKSSSETAKSQAGVAAGKVIDVSGTVSVRHGDVACPLAKGDAVEGDDTIETGADGHVLIELAHNNATWELNANKTSKVRESLAWSEPKRDRSAKAVEQDTAAAGRPAERNAAETTASAKADEQAPMAPPTAQAAPGAAPAAVTAAPPAPEPEAALEKTARGAEADGKIAPKASRRDMAPPPPPPSPTQSTTREVVPGAAAPPAPTGGTKGERERALEDAKQAGTLVEGGAGGGGGGGGTGGKIGSLGAFGGAGGSSAGKTLVRAKSDDIAKCWAGQKIAVSIRIVIKADGTAATTVKTLTGGAVTPQVEACVKKVISTIEFPAKADTVSLTLGS